jgi:hypothetical protein
VHDTHQVDVEQAPPVIELRVEERSADGDPGVVDHDVGYPVRGEHGRGELSG